jgi:hypothetical protein
MKRAPWPRVEAATVEAIAAGIEVAIEGPSHHDENDTKDENETKEVYLGVINPPSLSAFAADVRGKRVA